MHFSKYVAPIVALAIGVSAAPVEQAAGVSKRDATYGAATFFYPGEGACGWWNTDSDWIVAVNSAQYDGGSHCGQTVTVQANGITQSATVADECPTCDYGQLDMSPSFFNALSAGADGEFGITWWFD